MLMYRDGWSNKHALVKLNYLTSMLFPPYDSFLNLIFRQKLLHLECMLKCLIGLINKKAKIEKKICHQENMGIDLDPSKNYA